MLTVFAGLDARDELGSHARDDLTASADNLCFHSAAGWKMHPNRTSLITLFFQTCLIVFVSPNVAWG